MFHAGDLNSGISLAIQQQKFVACFIRKEDDEESQTWEDGWLQEESSDGRPLGEAFGDKAVLLKLEHGSQEAKFLSAFCPVEKVPMLVIIQNGQVMEKLESGVSREDFEYRVKKAVGLEEEKGGAEQVATSGVSTTTPATTPANTVPHTTASIQDVMQERGQRLEAERIQREASEGAERLARTNARRKEAEEAAAAHGYGPGGDKGKQRATAELNDKDKSRRDWIFQQKQRKDEAKKERVRILERIEADKLERKLRAQRLKEPEQAASFTESWQAPGPASNVQNSSTVCSLQVRLFDGSSVRSRFPPTASLAKEVREWIKEASPDNAENRAPFTFRQILAPSPPRSIGVSEEHQTVQELGLSPNATLVLVPVAGFTDAYSAGNSGGLMGLGYGLANGAWGLAGSLGSYLPSFARDQAAEVTPGPNSDTSGPATVRVKTLADQRDAAAKKDETEFYNGNSLGFEARKDDDESGKK